MPPFRFRYARRERRIIRGSLRRIFRFCLSDRLTAARANLLAHDQRRSGSATAVPETTEVPAGTVLTMMGVTV